MTNNMVISGSGIKSPARQHAVGNKEEKKYGEHCCVWEAIRFAVKCKNLSSTIQNSADKNPWHPEVFSPEDDVGK